MLKVFVLPKTTHGHATKCTHITPLGFWHGSIMLLVNVHIEGFPLGTLVVAFIAINMFLTLSSVLSVLVRIQSVPSIASIVTLVTRKSLVGINPLAMFPQLVHPQSVFLVTRVVTLITYNCFLIICILTFDGMLSELMHAQSVLFFTRIAALVTLSGAFGRSFLVIL